MRGGSVYRACSGKTATMRRQSNRRRGHTLLELVGATTIIALTLVPALRLMRDSLRVARETERANLLTTMAASKLEENLIQTAGNWNPTTVSGNFSANGYPTIKFSIVRSDNPGAGGMTDSLMALTSTVWDDLDNDNAWDVGEPRMVFASKLARNVAYEFEAAGQ